MTESAESLFESLFESLSAPGQIALALVMAECERQYIEQRQLTEAVRAYLDMEPPATASPYWHKPDGDLRAALADYDRVCHLNEGRA